MHVAHLSHDGRLVALHAPTRKVPVGLRRALVARDGGCVHRGCAAPAARCDAHHLVHWADGGATAITNLVLLCPRHHASWHRDQLTITDLRYPGEPPPGLRRTGRETAAG